MIMRILVQEYDNRRAGDGDAPRARFEVAVYRDDDDNRSEEHYWTNDPSEALARVMAVLVPKPAEQLS
jgi:hypothetical protein